MIKKVCFFLTVFCLFSISFISCSKNNNEKNDYYNEVPIEETIKEVKDEFFQDIIIDPEKFFTLDYTPYIPEKEFHRKSITDFTSKTSVNSKKTKISGKNTESVVPGLRDLSNYKTDYKTTPIIPADKLYDDTITGSLASQKLSGKDNQNKEDFTVAAWGPMNTIPAKIRQPEFYVLFSEPVVPLAALGSEITTSDIFTINPPLEGVFRWNGTSTLSFIPSEKIKPEETYTIKVSNSLKSLTGKKLKGEKEFTTTSEKLKIIWDNPGFKYREQHFEYFSKNNVPPEAAKEYRVQFNYLVEADEIKRISTITIGNKQTKNFTVVQETKDTVTYYINEKIPTETLITLQVGSSAKSSFSTVSKFKFTYYNPGTSYGKYTNPVYLEFSHPLEEKSVLDNISTSLDYKITKDNLEISGSTITIYNLPVTFNSKYKITIGENLTDIYGRKLNEKQELEILVPNAESSSRFTNYGTCILEAKYPHVMVFEHQNLLEGSVYLLNKTDNPLNTESPNWNLLERRENAVKIPTEPKNQRILEKVDLEPYLTNGKGMVRFEAVTKHPIIRNGKESGEYENTNLTTIQVTDLGVTARFGINRTVVLVSKLSDGTPVPNAQVYIYDGNNKSITEVLEQKQYLALGTTDENGLGIINYDPKKAEQWLQQRNAFGINLNPGILVLTQDDAVTFFPTSHNPWRSGIWNYYSPKNALNIKPVTFMFSDRGLYKPGETVTIRGIDKNLNLGTYIPYKGKYEIKVKQGGWNTISVLESENMEGITSDSGGFYCSFTLPENLEPGYYSVEYSRLDTPHMGSKSVSINVSYFERLKFQSSVAMPVTTIISGDEIQSTLSASYLAGGVPGGASYKASWTSEPWYFTSEDLAFKGYRFGPINNTDNMTYLSNDSGTLNGTGKAILKCETKENSIKGSPYKYRVSAQVTDVSNQMISTSGSLVVHPGNFYIGISKPDNVNYLVKKGQNLDFKYKLALPNGEQVKSLKTIGEKKSKLKAELLREEWNMVQQQGVNGDVYPRYVKETIVESSQTLNLDTEGKITVCPENVGYYTLRVSSKDSKSRDIITEYNFFATGSTNYWVMDSTESSLKLTPDQNLYNPGDNASILLESPLPAGNYLITVEREGIFTEEVRHFDSSVNTIEIPIARNYVPVCYVSVSTYSVRSEDPQNQYGVKDVNKPKGYFGVTPIHINPYVKAFSIDVKSEKMAYKPGEEASITVKATKGGKPLANAEITLMAVDRGVLDLINYHVPNPIDYFYNEGMFPLRVQGGDSRAFLMDPVTYSVKNLMGGDAGADESKLNQRKDFNPTALFEPVIITDKNGEATCKFKLPDTLTTYRVTAFGVKDELLALEENEFAVQNQINVQQVTPRRLRERDTCETGVILTNLDSEPHEISVTLEVKTPENLEANKGVKKNPGIGFVDGENKHKVTVLPGATIGVYFDVAAEKSGVINTVFTIKSDILNEQLIYPLNIEKPYIFEQVTSTGSIIDNEKKGTEGVIIPSFAEDGIGSLTLTLDATRLGPLGSSVKYLFDYPYGCIEQQASRILPLVIFEEYIDVFNMELDEKITDIHSLVVSYFEKWSKIQHGNGGFGYWPSSSKSNYYVSTKVAQTYALALKRGYTKEELCIDGENLANYLYYELLKNKNLSVYNQLNGYDKAFAMYTISLLDSTKINSEDLKGLLELKNPDISVLCLGGLGALNIQDKKLAEKFKTEIMKYLRPNTQSVDITSEGISYSFWSPIYSSDSERYALTLELFAMLNPKDPMVTKLVFTLLQKQQSGYWESTAATARVLESFYVLIKESQLDKLNLTGSASMNGNPLVQGSFIGPGAKPVKKQISFQELENIGITPGTLSELTFQKEGTGDLYYTTSLKYALPYEVQVPRDEGLSVIYKLYNEETGEEILINSEESPVISLESGKIYRMDIILSSPKNRTYVALRAPVPSGAEILDATFVTTPDNVDSYSGNSSWEKDTDEGIYDDGYRNSHHYMSNQTILDNEIQFFWDIFQKGTTKATFKFRAGRRGVFPTPPVTAEAMYESEIFGRTYGSLYTIK